MSDDWAMNRSEETYGKDAAEFFPERYLDKEGQLLPLSVFNANKEEGHVSYGFGRRICIGRHLSNNSLLINIASMLWMYVLQPSLDRDGEPIIPPEADSVNQVLVV
ncbi:hypothetical protein C0991_002395 [Blastosporella zonata]|nr:hypothetical protein C0991_002395 [Blastosporella zonata]